MERYNADCLIIGGGVSGLAIGSSLAKRFENIFIVERNSSLGQETSSRNSEVIHAGIYYKKDSLKSKLCIEGKRMLYDYLEERKIQHMRCGKFIISTTDEETEKLENIFKNAQSCGVDDLKFDNSIKESYPFIRSKESLFSPSTGIFDSHSFMSSLRNDFEQEKGTVLLSNECLSVESNGKGFEILIHDKKSQEKFILQTKHLINCAGINATQIANDLYEEEKFKNKYIKGEYYTYQGKEKLNHLIYPTPTQYSIGLHVTIDLGKGIRFGPSAYEISEIDYSQSEEMKSEFHQSVQAFWPGLKEEDLSPGYAGIRPTLEGEDDFVVDVEDFNGAVIVNVLGYASPGLTSSLALSKLVESRLVNYFN
jgi:L-2-hydroxyglutarate oxidase LhgO